MGVEADINECFNDDLSLITGTHSILTINKFNVKYTSDVLHAMPTVRNIRTKLLSTKKPEYNDSERMTDKQENWLDVKASQMNINVEEMFKEVFSLNVKRKITKGQASDAIKKLNLYQQKEEEIPESIVGYLSDWRNS